MASDLLRMDQVAAMDKVMGILDKSIPDAGFVLGLESPTKADLVILIMTQALIPFGATLGEYDFGAKVSEQSSWIILFLLIPATCSSVHPASYAPTTTSSRRPRHLGIVPLLSLLLPHGSPTKTASSSSRRRLRVRQRV